MKILIIGLVLILLIPFFGLVWFFIATITSPSPPKPIITRGEFNIKLVYEINGREFTIEDTIIIEFAGINHFSVNGKHRQWRHHLASNRQTKNILLLQLYDGSRIYYHVGSPNYYIGDLDVEIEQGAWYPFNAVFIARGNNQSSVGGPEGLLNEFGIRLISWEYDLPIENSFK